MGENRHCDSQNVPHRAMKKFLLIMGAIFCRLIVLLVVAFIFVAIRGTGLDKESKA